MSTDTDQPQPRGCRPLGLDFDKLAALIAQGEDKRGPLPASLRTVEHAIMHLREECELNDREIARVLLTASVLLGELANELGPKWNATACANWLALSGRRLWDAGRHMNTGRHMMRMMAPHGLGLGLRHRVALGQDEPEAHDEPATQAGTDE